MPFHHMGGKGGVLLIRHTLIKNETKRSSSSNKVYLENSAVYLLLVAVHSPWSLCC